MLEARSISVHRGSRVLLSEVSVTLEPGRVLAVLGPNGAGKSTLLQAMAGNRPPTSGEVLLDGRDVARCDALALARRRAALLQGTSVGFSFDAVEVVLLGRLPHAGGGRSVEDRRIAEAALREVDALHLADRDVNRLSGGERQRIHIARALAQIWSSADDHGRCLLLDEPTTGLDLEHQHRVLQLTRRHADAGVAVMVVLHDLNLAARYADAVLILRQGVLAELGTPREVLRPETVRRHFGVRAEVIEHPAVPGCPFVVDLGVDDEIAEDYRGLTPNR